MILKLSQKLSRWRQNDWSDYYMFCQSRNILHISNSADHLTMCYDNSNTVISWYRLMRYFDIIPFKRFHSCCGENTVRSCEFKRHPGSELVGGTHPLLPDRILYWTSSVSQHVLRTALSIFQSLALRNACSIAKRCQSASTSGNSEIAFTFFKYFIFTNHCGSVSKEINQL